MADTSKTPSSTPSGPQTQRPMTREPVYSDVEDTNFFNATWASYRRTYGMSAEPSNFYPRR